MPSATIIMKCGTQLVEKSNKQVKRSGLAVKVTLNTASGKTHRKTIVRKGPPGQHVQATLEVMAGRLGLELCEQYGCDEVILYCETDEAREVLTDLNGLSDMGFHLITEVDGRHPEQYSHYPEKRDKVFEQCKELLNREINS